MDKEKLLEIFDTTESEWIGDNTFKGMQIIAKYNDNIVRGAGHDIIYCGDIDECLEKGMTEADATELAKLNWMIDEEGFSKFV